MVMTLRPAHPSDAETCGRICFEAFRAIAQQHNFPPDFANSDMAVGLLSFLTSNPAIYSVVAELNGRVVGSNFLWENCVIASVGPITVDPSVQNSSVGRSLMNDVLARAAEQRFPGVRLVQSAYHGRSLSLYTKLGFDAREPLSAMQGEPIGRDIPGYPVRQTQTADLEECNALCRRIHGIDRGQELLGAIQQGTSMVVERNERITGYATLIGFFGHAVCESNEDLKALIAAAPSFAGPGFLLPTRNAELMRWCLNEGLRIVQPLTLMSTGLYNEPAGAFLPSILF
ncbi:MAG: GNAT family N-acetyltransferase [Steroidobacteraceae bacterium]